VLCLSSDSIPTATDWIQISKMSKLIPKICHNVNRVCYVFGEAIKFPVQDVTPTFLTTQVLATLREADHRAHQVLKNNNCYHLVAQMPVILIPIHFDRDYVTGCHREPSVQRSIVIRSFITEDFMTGVPAIPDQQIPFTVFQQMADQIIQVPGISRVLYDLTPKPPGTTEWE
jgi:GMP synthase (glutamine-hydrolysing)